MKLTANVTDMDDFKAKVQASLRLSPRTEITITKWDMDFDDYISITKLTDFENGKGKIKVTIS